MRTFARLVVAVTIAAPGFNQAISDQDVAHWTRAAGGEGKALDFLIEGAWTEGEARERGVVVTRKEAREAVDEKPHDGLTRSDLVQEARTTLLAARIRDQIAQPAAQGVTPEQIDAYVQTHSRTEPERRRTRLIPAPSRAKAKQALRALAHKVTWRSTARRYGGGTGAPRTIEPGLLPKKLEQAVFDAPKNALTRYGTYVFKVIAIIAGGPTPLDQQRATAWEILSSEAQTKAITNFKTEFRARWRLRTTCAPAYESHPDCANPPTVE